MAKKFWMGPGGTVGAPTSGSWTSTGAWRTTSGGSTTTTTPGTGDEAIFDNNSISGNTAVTVTFSAIITVGSINASGLSSGSGSVTIAGTNNVTISNGAGTGSGLDLPASRLTWTASGNVLFAGTGTVTTRGVTLGGGVVFQTAGSAVTLNDNLTCAGILTMTNGGLDVQGFQLACSTCTMSGTSAVTITATAGGGITATAASGTVVNNTKTNVQLTFPGAKPTFTLANASGAGRTITWAGATWATNTSSMPAIKVNAGSDTITLGLGTSPTYHNLAGLDCTGFSGTILWAAPASFLYIFGNFVVPAVVTFTMGTTSIYLEGTGNSLAANCPNNVLYMEPTSVYTQVGVISVPGFFDTGTITTGSLTINGTGTISGHFKYPNTSSAGLIMSGAVAFGTANSSGIYVKNPNTTALTSVTKTGSSDAGAVTFNGGSYSSSVSFTFNGSNKSLSILNTTISGTVTFNAALTGEFAISESTIASVVTATCGVLTLNGIVNLPGASVISVNATDATIAAFFHAYSAFDGPTNPLDFTTKFRVNVNVGTSASTCYIYGGLSVNGNDPDLYLTGAGPASFDDASIDSYNPWFSSVDMTGFSGTIAQPFIYIKNALTQSSSSTIALNLRLYPSYAFPSLTGTFTLNTPVLGSVDGGGNVQTIDFVPATVTIQGASSVRTTLKLNSCNLRLGNGLYAPTGTVLAGTSTITLYSGGALNVGSQNLNNVVLTSGGVGVNYGLNAGYVANLSNTAQPFTLTMYGNVSFGVFSINGTAGNLVNLVGLGNVVRTLTKPNAWTLANSTDGGNNTGLTFGSTGNNSYLNVSYINGVVSSTANTSNFFALF